MNLYRWNKNWLFFYITNGVTIKFSNGILRQRKKEQLQLLIITFWIELIHNKTVSNRYSFMDKRQGLEVRLT